MHLHADAECSFASSEDKARTRARCDILYSQANLSSYGGRLNFRNLCKFKFIENMVGEGRAPLPIKGIPIQCETFYKVFGDLDDVSKTPLFVLHGGPAAGHEYMLSLNDLVDVVIIYDQIGCGQSTLLPDKAGDENFWTPELFCNELSNLITYLGLRNRPIDILGHSWGGMLACEWAADASRAANLRHMVLYSSFARTQDYAASMLEVRERLPQDAQDAVQRGLQNEDFKSAEFTEAMTVFTKSHMSLDRPYPKEELVLAMQRTGTSDVYRTMFGPHPLAPIGSLRSWDSIHFLHQIKVPTLMIRGSEECILESAMQPLFDHLPKIKWITFNDAAHFSHIEQREKFFAQVRQFLAN